MVCQTTLKPLLPRPAACASISRRSSITICGRNGRPYCLPSLMTEASARAGRTSAGNATRPPMNSRLFTLPSDATRLVAGLPESEQACRIIGKNKLAQLRIGRPFADEIIELDGTDPVVERQMRKIAAPDQLAGRPRHQRLRDRLHRGESRRRGEAIDAGELDKATRRAVADQIEKRLKAGLVRTVLGRKQPHMRDRKLDRQFIQRRHQLADQPPRRQEVEK